MKVSVLITNIIPVNNHIAHTKSTTLPKSPVVQSSASNCDALQKQLAFMGAINKPVINSGAAVLEKYKKNLESIKIDGATVLFSAEKNKGRIILFDKPLSFVAGIEKIARVEQKWREKSLLGKVRVAPKINLENYDYYSKNIEKSQLGREFNIKGIMGDGCSCSAFLTDDNSIMKIAKNPIFPLAEEMIEGVDIPIKRRFAQTLPGQRLFVAIEPLAENQDLRPISPDEYKDILKKFYPIMKEKNQKYEFAGDLSINMPAFSYQIGFVDGSPYLLDHQAIKHRPLVGE